MRDLVDKSVGGEERTPALASSNVAAALGKVSAGAVKAGIIERALDAI
jgi:hypothetical protein